MHTVILVHVDTHLIRLGAGQTARQRPTVGGQSGGERRAAVCQNGLQVTGQLLRDNDPKSSTRLQRLV